MLLTAFVRTSQSCYFLSCKIYWGCMLEFIHNSSVRNNGQTLDIYRPNEAFVQPFVISLDILSGVVAAGVEFRMNNPYPRTSLCHVNKRSFRSLRTKQTQTATHCTCTYCIAECVFCQIPDVGTQVHTLGLQGVQQNAADSHGPYTVNAAG